MLINFRHLGVDLEPYRTAPHTWPAAAGVTINGRYIDSWACRLFRACKTLGEATGSPPLKLPALSLQLRFASARVRLSASVADVRGRFVGRRPFVVIRSLRRLLVGLGRAPAGAASDRFFVN